MFKLVTGLPGAGKTSNELWNFLKSPDYQGRPKYCTPVNGFDAVKHGVTEIEHIKVWEDLPDGSVIFCDEVQDYCGTDIGKEPPEWVKQISRHRHRGFDFIVTTQNPMMLHSYVRKLVQPHVHYTNPFGMTYTSYQWETAQSDPNAKSAKTTGQRKDAKPNKEVFSLYTSTVLDTHKARPPYKILITFAVVALLAIASIVYGAMRIWHVNKDAEIPPAAQEVPQQKAPEPITVFGTNIAQAAAPELPATNVWTKENIQPRIAGEPQTAPIYDNLTAPTDFPRVAGCMASKSRNTCNCYTQQGTPVDVPRSACEVFVQVGHFDPWLSGRKQQELASRQSQQPQQPVQAPVQQKPLAPQLVAQEQAQQPARPQRASFRIGKDQ